MDLRHLRYFVSVAEQRSVSRAALRLHVAQPALSRQVRALEKELGAALLKRIPKGVELTPLGESFLAGAQAALAQTQAAVERALRAALQSQGRLVIGMGRPTLLIGWVQHAWAALCRQFPDADLQQREVEGGPTQWRQLRAGEIDLAIGLQPPGQEPGVQSEPLLDATLECALLPAAHPLAARTSLQPADLARLPLLMPQPQMHPELFEKAQTALRLFTVMPPLVFQYTGPHALWMAVGAGHGWSLAPRAFMDVPPEGTVAVPVEGLRVPLSTSVIWRSDEIRPLVHRVVAALRAIRDGVALQPRGGGGAAEGSHAASPGRPPKPLRGIELRQLRALVAVVEEKSFGRASERLGITQPALSRQVKDLEREVGAALLERLPRGARATAAGESLARDATELLAALDNLAARTKRARRLGLRRCNLGAVDLAQLHPVVQELLRVCGTRHPDIEIVVQELPAQDQGRALLEGRIDLGLGHLDTPGPGPHIARRPLSRYAFDSALLPPAHPLAGRPMLRSEELAAIPFLFVSPEADALLYDQVMGAFARLGFRPGTILTYGSLQTTRALAAQGKGWALGVGRQRRGPPPAGRLVAVPIAGLTIPWGLELLWRHNETSPTVLAIVEAAGPYQLSQ